MSLTHRILGTPGRDNALFVAVDSGQAVERLLFDCGEGCLSELEFGEVLAIDGVFFSHLHMDHVAGFDGFFRANYRRDTQPNRIWGPPDTARIMQHRFQGYLWNLHGEMSASWQVAEIHPAEIRTTRFELSEAFAVAHTGETRSYERTITGGEGYRVEAFTMDHRTPTIAYVVRENPRRNIDMAKLAGLGLRPGPWLKALRDTDAPTVTIDGTARAADELRRQLIVETPGDSIAYLTDFLLDEPATERLAEALRGCRVLVCEAQYRHADLELARKNYHMTTRLTATLAARAGVEQLILFHLSDRYQPPDWRAMLDEAREIFPNTSFPPSWNL
jgi:ribonuclease Z